MNTPSKTPRPKVRKAKGSRGTQVHDSKARYKRRKLRVKDAEEAENNKPPR